jgi:hypothetical protein
MVGNEAKLKKNEKDDENREVVSCRSFQGLPGKKEWKDTRRSAMEVV